MRSVVMKPYAHAQRAIITTVNHRHAHLRPRLRCAQHITLSLYVSAPAFYAVQTREHQAQRAALYGVLLCALRDEKVTVSEALGAARALLLLSCHQLRSDHMREIISAV